jgi:hypothetical protein
MPEPQPLWTLADGTRFVITAPTRGTTVFTVSGPMDGLYRRCTYGDDDSQQTFLAAATPCDPTAPA